MGSIGFPELLLILLIALLVFGGKRLPRWRAGSARDPRLQARLNGEES